MLNLHVVMIAPSIFVTLFSPLVLTVQVVVDVTFINMNVIWLKVVLMMLHLMIALPLLFLLEIVMYTMDSKKLVTEKKLVDSITGTTIPV